MYYYFCFVERNHRYQIITSKQDLVEIVIKWQTERGACSFFFFAAGVISCWRLLYTMTVIIKPISKPVGKRDLLLEHLELFAPPDWHLLGYWDIWQLSGSNRKLALWQNFLLTHPPFRKVDIQIPWYWWSQNYLITVKHTLKISQCLQREYCIGSCKNCKANKINEKCWSKRNEKSPVWWLWMIIVAKSCANNKLKIKKLKIKNKTVQFIKLSYLMHTLQWAYIFLDFKKECTEPKRFVLP